LCQVGNDQLPAIAEQGLRNRKTNAGGPPVTMATPRSVMMGSP
jgi:hypothetical protein